MSAINKDRLSEFQTELKALVLKYDVELRACTGYYGEPEGVEIFCGQKSAAQYDYERWNFGDGLQSIEQLRADAQATSQSNKRTVAASPGDLLCVTVADGKYTVKQDASGRLIALRYGEPWRDCVGDGLICALAYEVDSLREQLARVRRGRGLNGRDRF